MNGSVLERGQALNARLRDLTDTASGWVADLGADPWPGRRSEALRVHDRLQRALQDAREAAGELVVILAQDVAP